MRRTRSDSGQTILTMALVVPVLFGFFALVIDGGKFVNERRDLQGDADFAALAGALELPAQGAAVVSAREWLTRNGIDVNDPDISIEINTPYEGNPDRIEVIVTRPTGLFLPLLSHPMGLGRVTARAVAEHVTGDGYAIFANASSCSTSDPLEFSGSVNTTIGAVHSNSDIKVPGSDNVFNGEVTYRCNFDNSGGNNSYIPGATLVGPERPLPVSHTYDDFACTVTYAGDTDLSSEDVWLDANKTQLESGIYCSEGKLQLSGQGVSGDVTLVARGEVSVSGSDFDLRPHPAGHGVLIFSENGTDSAVDISGSGGGWRGLIYADAGRVKMQGSDNLSLTGSIVADRVSVSGSNFSISADDDGGEAYIYLYE